MQNGFIERLNWFYREDVLDAYWFNDLYQLKTLTNKWMEDYNNNHPHQSLGDKSPREYLPRTTDDLNEKPESFNKKLLNLELS